VADVSKITYLSSNVQRFLENISVQPYTTSFAADTAQLNVRATVARRQLMKYVKMGIECGAFAHSDIQTDNVKIVVSKSG
jgi:hypothetical protein